MLVYAIKYIQTSVNYEKIQTFETRLKFISYFEKARLFSGDLIYKANHIALTVSDIGRSLYFYSDILGLQQIKRPNFDRHGAWLTMGNIELHLILGQPIVPSEKI